MLPFIYLGPLEIPTYFLVISLVACLSLWWIRRRARQLDLHPGEALDLGLLIMISGFVGARLAHILVEHPQLYWDDPWQVLRFWQGGFVFYGGALGAFIIGLLWLRHKQMIVPLWLDFFTPIAALSYALGRLACLLAGCCYGRVCEPPLWIFERHPTQLYAFFWEIGALFILLGIEKSQVSSKSPFWQHLLKQPGSLFSLWIGLHGLGRLFMESFRDDFRGPLLLGLSVSAYFSILLILTSLGLLFVRARRMSHLL